MAMSGAEKQRRFRARRKQCIEELKRENAELRARIETCSEAATKTSKKDDDNGDHS